MGESLTAGGVPAAGPSLYGAGVCCEDELRCQGWGSELGQIHRTPGRAASGGDRGMHTQPCSLPGPRPWCESDGRGMQGVPSAPPVLAAHAGRETDRPLSVSCVCPPSVSGTHVCPCCSNTPPRLMVWQLNVWDPLPAPCGPRRGPWLRPSLPGQQQGGHVGRGGRASQQPLSRELRGAGGNGERPFPGTALPASQL